MHTLAVLLFVAAQAPAVDSVPPWLTLLASAAVSLVIAGIAWGTQYADVKALKKSAEDADDYGKQIVKLQAEAVALKAELDRHHQTDATAFARLELTMRENNLAVLGALGEMRADMRAYDARREDTHPRGPRGGGG